MILDKKMQIFLAVAETGSFSQASKKFSLSQSVISFHIDTLEQDLGVRLFERHGRMISLSQEGEYLFQEGKKLALSARQLEDSFSEHSSILARYIRVAGCTLTCDEIRGTVWGHSHFVTLHDIDQAVSTLQDIIEPNPGDPVFIHRIIDIGYKFIHPEPDGNNPDS